MNTQESTNPKRNRNNTGHLILGLVVIALGFGLLLDKLDIVFFPHWVFSWPMILIAIGLAIGAKQNFTGGGWLVMVLVGTFFLLDQITPYHWHLYRYGLPVGIIIVGLFILFRSVMRSSDPDRNSWRHSRREWQQGTNDSANATSDQPRINGEDFFDITNFFGGTKKRIFSKDFKGGDIVNFFGGTDLDFTQADIKDGSVATLDVTQVFGGVKLIVPANWTVKSDMVSILAGFDDKRSNVQTTDGSRKVLRIDGTCILGGVEIKSY